MRRTHLIRGGGLLALAALAMVSGSACIAVFSSGRHHKDCGREVVEIDGAWYMVDLETREARRIHIVKSEVQPRPNSTE
jgi:hypothetical protein